MTIEIRDWISIYAAVVATGVMALEVWRWFESGPKVIVTVATGLDSQSRNVHATVTNRGDAATTIRYVAIIEYSNLWDWLRQNIDMDRSYVMCRCTELPHILAPGTYWTGDEIDVPAYMGDLRRGTVWVAVYTSARDRPYLAVMSGTGRDGLMHSLGSGHAKKPSPRCRSQDVPANDGHVSFTQ